MIKSKSIITQEAYYKNLVIKYNPENSFYKRIVVVTKDDLFKQVYSMIAQYLEEQITLIQEQYEEIEQFWAGEGEYYLLISPCFFGQVGIYISISRT